MKFKYNDSLYKTIIFIADIALILLTMLTYFLGWELNIKSFLIFLSIIFGIFVFSVLVYLAIYFFNKTYIHIDREEIRKVGKNTDVILLKTSQVLYTKYLNKIEFIDFINPISELGCMEITYKKEDSLISAMRIYCSKKIYKKIIADRYLPKY